MNLVKNQIICTPEYCYIVLWESLRELLILNFCKTPHYERFDVFKEESQNLIIYRTLFLLCSDLELCNNAFIKLGHYSEKVNFKQYTVLSIRLEILS